MPAAWCEPLSLLQRMSETITYADLLNKASECSDPAQRLEYIAGFAVSTIASSFARFSKPFNPLLGETYEINRFEIKYLMVYLCILSPQICTQMFTCRDDIGLRMISEQVSHHVLYHKTTTFYSRIIFYQTKREFHSTFDVSILKAACVCLSC